MRVRLFLDIGHVMTKNRLGRADENKNVHVYCLLGLKHMTTYERVKPATAGTVADTYLELKMLCLFYFALESKKMAIMSGLQKPEKRFYFSPF